jgi:5,10-methylenetetrahydrofolate reductase
MNLPLSFEFFPPKTPEGAAKLRVARQDLYAHKPEFCSVTFGAGGSTQEGTFGTVKEILDEGVAAASHFSCVGATKATVREQLAMLRAMGVKRLVALRGDLPSGYGAGGEFHYASDLVAFIREETGDAFRIEVAAYPEIHPRPGRPMPTCRPSSKRSRPAPTPPSRSISSTPTLISASSTMRRPWAWTCPSCPASCRSRVPRS